MSTPFAPFANAIVTFRIKNPEANTEIEVGEYGHEVAPLVDYPVLAYFSSERGRGDLFDGGNQETIPVRGRCISPKILSNDIQPEVLADCVFLVSRATYKFRYSPSIESPFYDEASLLGQRLEGVLIRTTIDGGAT